MPSQSFQTNRHRILRVQLFIEEHLDEELPLDRLADVAHLSPYHFHRIFRALVGETVAEYVRRIRLEFAAILLKSTSQSVTRIALDAGYSSHEAFTRAFRRRFGMSPSDCRDHHISTFNQRERVAMSSDTGVREVRIEALPQQRLAFLRHVGPYDQCGPTFEKLMECAGALSCLGPNTKVIAICHDDPEVTPAEKLRLDCCFTVDESFEPQNDLQIQTIDAGDHAILTHHGSYAGLADSYRWLFGEWLQTSGREFDCKPPFEVYHNDPKDTPEDELITDICVALKSA